MSENRSVVCSRLPGGRIDREWHWLHWAYGIGRRGWAKTRYCGCFVWCGRGVRANRADGKEKRGKDLQQRDVGEFLFLGEQRSPRC